MSLPVFVEGWFAMLIAFAVLVWVCTTLPFRLGFGRVVKDPVRGLLLLLPGAVGVVLLQLVSRIEWDGGGWLGRRLFFGVLIGGIVAMVQLGGLVVLLAREHRKTLAPAIAAMAVLPIVGLSVLVPLAEQLLRWLLHLLLDWTGFMGWFIKLVMLGVNCVLVVFGWFAIKWALNVVTRTVMGLGNPEAASEVDAQVTADSLGWTIWPFAVVLGMLVPVMWMMAGMGMGMEVEFPEAVRAAIGAGMREGLVASDVPMRFMVGWPHVLAPQGCTWGAALPWSDRVFVAFVWDLVFMAVQAVMVVGFVEAYVRHRGMVVAKAG